MREVVVTLRQREWQKPLTAYFRHRRQMQRPAHASVIAHRRAGKDRVSLFIELEEALASPREVWHCLPEYAQARKVVWQALDGQGKRLIEQAFPAEIIKRKNDQEMTIELVNGSLWRLVGADNFNALVGSNPRHVTFSEFALTMPKAREFVRPILAENGGTELTITTPRGYNHAFHRHEYALKNPEWYAGFHPVSQTKLISDEVLAEERASMPDELYRQEWECSFSAANVGAILGSRIEAAELEGRVSDEELYDASMPVIVSTDIGFRDAAAFWFWQMRPDGYALVDYAEDSGLDADDWIERLRRDHARYDIERFWMPHDARAKTFATKRSAIERFRDAGFPVALTPETSIDHRINAARLVLPRCRFHKGRCARGLMALRNWAYKWSDVNRVFSSEPLHDEWSNGADAFTYGALTAREATVPSRAPKLPKQAAATFRLDQLFADRDEEAAAQEWR